MSLLRNLTLCLDSIARFKRPKNPYLSDSCPKTTTGKFSKQIAEIKQLLRYDPIITFKPLIR